MDLIQSVVHTDESDYEKKVYFLMFPDCPCTGVEWDAVAFIAMVCDKNAVDSG